MPKEVIVVVLGALPISELRGAIPTAIAFGFSPLKAYSLSFLGNILPIVPILFLFEPISNKLRHISVFERFFTWLFARTRKRASLVEKFEFFGLILFVAIPLPVTGAWTGCVAATLFKVRFRYALAAIILGVAIAGVIVLTLSMGGKALLANNKFIY
jgi:uncharacterized membrane protein